MCSNTFTSANNNIVGGQRLGFRSFLLPSSFLLKNAYFHKKKFALRFYKKRLNVFGKQVLPNTFKFYLLFFLLFNFRLVFKTRFKRKRMLIGKFFVSSKKKIRHLLNFSFLKSSFKRVLFLQVPSSNLHKNYLKTSYALRLFKVLRLHAKAFSYIRTRVFRRKDKLSKFKYRIMRCVQRLK